MKTLGTKNVEDCDVSRGEFNGGEHLLLELEPGRNQTISVKLPNGKHVTFAFIPGKDGDTECVDIHTTMGKAIQIQTRR